MQCSDNTCKYVEGFACHVFAFVASPFGTNYKHATYALKTCKGEEQTVHTTHGNKKREKHKNMGLTTAQRSTDLSILPLICGNGPGRALAVRLNLRRAAHCAPTFLDGTPTVLNNTPTVPVASTWRSCAPTVLDGTLTVPFALT